MTFCTIFLFLLFLWPLEEGALSWSVCKATAVGAPGTGKGWTRISLLSQPAAGCSHGCSNENQSPNSQATAVCFAWKSLCEAHSEVHPLLPSLPEKSCDLLTGCQIHDCSAEAQEWLSSIEIEFYNSICLCGTEDIASGLEFRAKPKKKGLGFQKCLSFAFSIFWWSYESRLVC